MPLFIDVHTIGDPVALDDVARAHGADLLHQHRYDVRYLRYWVDETDGRIFCLVDAPYAEAARAVHRQARGRPADEIYQVREGA